MTRRPSVFASIAASLVLTGSAHAFDPTYRTNPMGIVDHDEFTAIAGFGGHWMRLPLQWSYIEPTDNNFNWASGAAAWLDSADATGINASFVVQIGQMWASGFPSGTGDWPSYPPIDLTTTYHPTHAYSQLYYDFLTHFLTHYRGRIDRLTIENEANTTNFWAGTMDQYGRVLATAAKAVHDAAPEVLLFDSGLGSGSWGAAAAEWMYQGGQFTDAEVLQYANDYYRYDVYAPFHWNSFQELVYWLHQPFVQENNKHVRYMLATVPLYADGLNFKFTERSWLLPRLIEFMDAEMAVYGRSLPLKVNNEASNWQLDTEDAEGQNLLKMIVVGMAHGVAQSLWFPFRQDDTPRQALLDAAGGRTKQADAFENLADRLRESPTYAGFEYIDNRVHRYRFKRRGESEPRVDAMWWDNGAHGSGARTVSIPLPPQTDHVNIYEFDGRLTTVQVTDTLVTTVSHLGRLYEYVSIPTHVDPTAPPPIPAELSQNAPNPFGPSTSIKVSVDRAITGATLLVFNAQGERVRTIALGSLSAGEKSVSWDGRGDLGARLPSGTYFYRIRHDAGESPARSAVLVR